MSELILCNSRALFFSNFALELKLYFILANLSTVLEDGEAGR